jgi:transcriptional regulator with XRE-family HTH domain
MDSPDAETLKRVGKAIREARLRRGLSQQQLADLVGLNRQYLIDLEHGRGTTQLQRLVMLIHALGLDVRVIDRSTGRERA